MSAMFFCVYDGGGGGGYFKWMDGLWTARGNDDDDGFRICVYAFLKEKERDRATRARHRYTIFVCEEREQINDGAR